MATTKGSRRLSPQTMEQLRKAGYSHYGTGAEKFVDGVKYVLFRHSKGGWCAGRAGHTGRYDSVKAAIDGVEWTIQAAAREKIEREAAPVRAAVRSWIAPPEDAQMLATLRARTAAALAVAQTEYEKCADCHLFVEENYRGPEGEENLDLAEYVHLHRGDDADEALDETHNARPSGESHTIAYWREHGPFAMQARFIVADREKQEASR